MKIIVLGAGLVGAPMAIDLSKDDRFDVSVADFSKEALTKLNKKHPDISVINRDLSIPADVIVLVSEFDMVVNAVPGFMGFQTAKAIIEAGKNCACIAFYEEDPFELDQLAKEKDVSMIMDCGVYPGMGSALIMNTARKLDKVESVLTYVGGLPEIREWPSEYKAAGRKNMGKISGFGQPAPSLLGYLLADVSDELIVIIRFILKVTGAIS